MHSSQHVCVCTFCRVVVPLSITESMSSGFVHAASAVIQYIAVMVAVTGCVLGYAWVSFHVCVSVCIAECDSEQARLWVCRQYMCMQPLQQSGISLHARRLWGLDFTKQTLKNSLQALHNIHYTLCSSLKWEQLYSVWRKCIELINSSGYLGQCRSVLCSVHLSGVFNLWGEICSRVARCLKRIIPEPEAFQFSCIMFRPVKVSLHESPISTCSERFHSQLPRTFKPSKAHSHEWQASDLVAYVLAAVLLSVLASLELKVCMVIFVLISFHGSRECRATLNRCLICLNSRLIFIKTEVLEIRCF